MGGRTVQKYLEFPLLAPVISNDDCCFGTTKHRPNNMLSKFDMRVWVLVTSFKPLLEAHIYSQLYGRRCSSVYSAQLSTLGNSYAHLTNYSVQKKQKFASDAMDGAPSSSTSSSSASRPLSRSNSARKLRSAVSGVRSAGSGKQSHVADVDATDETDASSNCERVKATEAALLMGEHVPFVLLFEVYGRNFTILTLNCLLLLQHTTKSFESCSRLIATMFILRARYSQKLWYHE